MAESKKLPISVVISAVDNVTYKVMAINEKIKRITAPVGKVQAAFKTLGDEAGLGKLAKQFGKIGSTGKDFFSELGGALVKVGAVGLAAAGAIFGVVHSFSEAGDQVDMMASRLGLTTNAYQELAYAAKRADVDQETFNSSMAKFSKNIAEAAAGNGEALVGFNALGISVRDSSGHLRKMEDLLPTVADKLHAVQNQSVRNAIAAKLFGKEGMKLNGIFQEGAAGLAKLRQEARDVGAVMSPEDIKTAADFDDGMKSIGATLMMVRNIVGAALAPVLLNLGKILQTYILANKDKIKEFAAAFAERLPGVLEQIWNTLKSLASALQPVIRFVGFLADTFGTTAVVVAGLMVYFAPLIASFFSFMGAIVGLLPLLGTFWNILVIIAAVFKGLAVLLAGLVSLPVALGAAFVAAALLVWKYWGPITDKLTAWWDKFKSFFGSSTNINGTLTTSAAPALAAWWDKFKSFFGSSTNINGTLTTSAAPALAAPMGFSKSVDAAARSSTSKTDNHLLVEFENMPQGTTVQTKKADSLLDLSMGFGLAGGMP